MDIVDIYSNLKVSTVRSWYLNNGCLAQGSGRIVNVVVIIGHHHDPIEIELLTTMIMIRQIIIIAS